MKRAFITGITGQDGSYLTELLLAKGYQVFGMVRQSTRPNLEYLPPHPNLHFLQGDLLDQGSLVRCLEQSDPHEIYNLAALSFVGESWNQPVLTVEVNGLGTIRLLEAMRHVCPAARFYQASSSEMYGNAMDYTNGCCGGIDESVPFRPVSPYGTSKVLAHNAAVNYRESFGLHVSCGILFNHESPRRGQRFVTRTISQGVAKIKLVLADRLELGNLMAQRDWGFAGDYVQAMWLMLQQDRPDDYVIGTGESHEVEEFAQLAFRHVHLNYRDWVKTRGDLCRPNELHYLKANASKAFWQLGWRPTVEFEQLVKMMVDADLARMQGQAVAA